MSATVIPFAHPAACPGHGGGRFTAAGIGTIRRRYARGIATGRVSRVEWIGGADGDTAHVVGADGKVLATLYLDGGVVHAVGPLGAGGIAVAVARGRTVAAALDALGAGDREAPPPSPRAGVAALASPARPR